MEKSYKVKKTRTDLILEKNIIISKLRSVIILGILFWTVLILIIIFAVQKNNDQFLAGLIPVAFIIFGFKILTIWKLLIAKNVSKLLTIWGLISGDPIFVIFTIWKIWKINKEIKK